MRPPRIAYILLHAPSYSQTFVESEIRAVRAAGATVEVFTARDGGRRSDAGRVLRALVRHPVRLRRHVRALGAWDVPRAVVAGAHAIALRRDVARFAPDVLHAHFLNLPAAIAALLGTDLGRPATAIGHAADFLLDSNVQALDQRIRLLTHVFLISDAAVRQLADKGVDMPTISHGIVRAAFDGAMSEPRTRASGGAAKLVTAARLIEKKGVGTSIDAVAALVAAGVDVRYDIYGDGPLRGSLERRVAAKGLSAVVTLHGAVPHRVATEALGMADVAVLACTRGSDGDLDGIPVFLLEAAGRGIPVVTTAVSGVPELLGEAGGWLARPDDPVGLADAIRRVLADPDESRRRTDVLQSRIRSEFSPARQAARLIETWNALAGDISLDATAPRGPLPTSE